MGVYAHPSGAGPFIFKAPKTIPLTAYRTNLYPTDYDDAWEHDQYTIHIHRDYIAGRLTAPIVRRFTPEQLFHASTSRLAHYLVDKLVEYHFKGDRPPYCEIRWDHPWRWSVARPEVGEDMEGRILRVQLNDHSDPDPCSPPFNDDYGYWRIVAGDHPTKEEALADEQPYQMLEEFIDWVAKDVKYWEYHHDG